MSKGRADLPINLVPQNGLVVPDHLKAKVVVGYVHGGMVHEPFMRSVLTLFAFDAGQRRSIAGLAMCKGLYVAQNRNAVCKNFLTSAADWLFFLDTDIVFTPEQMYQLLDAAHPTERPIVGGLYFSYWNQDKDLCPVWLEHRGDDMATMSALKPGLQEVAVVGMGFTLIHRGVLEAMAKHHADDEWLWFGHDLRETPRGLERMGDDTTFCLRAADIGFKTFGHAEIVVQHIKSRAENYETFRQGLTTPPPVG